MQKSFFDKVKYKFYTVEPQPKLPYKRMFDDPKLQAKFDSHRKAEEDGVTCCAAFFKKNR